MLCVFVLCTNNGGPKIIAALSLPLLRSIVQTTLPEYRAKMSVSTHLLCICLLTPFHHLHELRNHAVRCSSVLAYKHVIAAKFFMYTDAYNDRRRSSVLLKLREVL